MREREREREINPCALCLCGRFLYDRYRTLVGDIAAEKKHEPLSALKYAIWKEGEGNLQS
jgi:hypothetical protein